MGVSLLPAQFVFGVDRDEFKGTMKGNKEVGVVLGFVTRTAFRVGQTDRCCRHFFSLGFFFLVSLSGVFGGPTLVKVGFVSLC